MSIFTIAELTFREARRKKLMWLALGLGTAFIIVFGIGLHLILTEAIEDRSPRRQPSQAELNIMLTQISGVLLVMGLFAVNFLVVMMTALTSVDTIAGEISSHTIQTLATKPVPRRDIILGKWLGHALLITCYIIFMFIGIIVTTYVLSGYLPPNIPTGLALMVLEGLIVLSLSIFGGTIFPTLANGVVVFMVYGLAFVGSWVEQIGAALESQAAIQVGIISSLLMPSESMWRIVADIMQPALIRQAGVPPITVYSRPSNAMVIYAIIYAIALLGGALAQFSRRDL